MVKKYFNMLRVSFVLCMMFFILFSIEIQAEEAGPKRGYYVGKIGDKISIQMDIETRSKTVEGTYYYESKGIPINVKGTLAQNNTLTLEEFDEKETVTGRFKGQFVPWQNSFEGTWSNPAGTKTLPFKITKAADYTFKDTRLEQKGMSVEVHAVYPTFLSNSSALTEIQNHAAKSIQSLHDEFIQDGKSMWSEPLPEESNMLYMYQWHRSIQYTIAYYSEQLISLLIIVYEFTGGTHGNRGYSSKNFSIKQGKAVPLELKNLFVANSPYLKVLSDFCIKELRKQEASSVVDGKIESLNEDNLSVFTLEPSGIRFVFAPYQVGSYAEGSFFVIVPYKELQKYLKPDGPLNNLIL